MNNDQVEPIAFHDAVINDEFLEQLFVDLAELTEIQEVLVKGGAEQHSNQGNWTIQEARELFLAQNVQAVQIRYIFEGSQWLDTLMHTPTGVRAVRIEHK